MWGRNAVRAPSRETVDELHDEVHLLRQVVRQLVLREGLYKADDPQAMRVVSLLSLLDVSHPLRSVPPEPGGSRGLDEPTLPGDLDNQAPASKRGQ
jgi:hypothetical protein